MFKYNYKIILPLIALFIVCLLFILINQKDLSYNPEIINQDFSENINSCNKRKKNLNMIPSRKNNNNKILDYVFENFTSGPVVMPDNNSSDFSMPESKFQEYRKEVQEKNKETIKQNIRNKKNYDDKKKSLDNTILKYMMHLFGLQKEKASLIAEKNKAVAEKAAADLAAAKKAAADKAAAEKEALKKNINRCCYLHNNYDIIPGKTFGKLEDDSENDLGNDLKINLKNEWINKCGLNEIDNADKINKVCESY